MAASYTLRDLITAASTAERLPVSERAVRQYLADGLLPPARGQGLATTYGEEHLSHLRLVLRLAGQYVPLAEIQRWIVTLGSGQIQALLERPAVPRLPVEGDAQAYLMRLQKTVSARAALGSAPSPAVPLPRSGPRQLPRPQGAQVSTAALPPGVDRWLHVALSADAVLLLRDGTYDAKGTAKLIEALQRALSEVAVSKVP